MTRSEFFTALDALVAQYPHYRVMPPDAHGNIVLRVTNTMDEAARQRSENFARAFRDIMTLDTRKPRGNGWI
jgi:hypothetical protein